MKNIRVVMIISGKVVQGIGFRIRMADMAKKLGVGCEVMNLPGGHQVKAILEGKEDKIKELIKWAKKGPPGAEVEKVDIFPRPYQGDLNGHRIVVSSK